MSSKSSNPVLSKHSSLLFMLKPDHWVIKAQSNASSHTRLVIPSRYFVPGGRLYNRRELLSLLDELKKDFWKNMTARLIPKDRSLI